MSGNADSLKKAAAEAAMQYIEKRKKAAEYARKKYKIDVPENNANE